MNHLRCIKKVYLPSLYARIYLFFFLKYTFIISDLRWIVGPFDLHIWITWWIFFFFFAHKIFLVFSFINLNNHFLWYGRIFIVKGWGLIEERNFLGFVQAQTFWRETDFFRFVLFETKEFIQIFSYYWAVCYFLLFHYKN